MQLWKKNFLVIYGIFLMVIYAGFLFLDSYISQNEMQQWIEYAKNSEKSIYYLVLGLKGEASSRISMNLSNVADKYKKSGIYIQVIVNGYTATDNFPGNLPAGHPVGIQKIGKDRCIVIQEEKVVDGSVIGIRYAKDLKELLQIQQRRLWIFCGSGIVLAGAIGLFLYYTMRRINRPVNQIAHELRTPLTGIRGYAEYLMMGKLTEEDRFYAASQIVDSAKNLEDITEKLLIMGNVREGSLQAGRINMEQMLSQLKEKYPDIEADCHLDFLNGDETLVSCMLDNLVSNASRAGTRVKLTADEKRIRIWNNGKPMDGKLLKEINKGQGIPISRVGKHGYGIQVCQQIAKAHGWRLHFRSSREEGTEVLCQFHAPYHKFL